MRPAPLATLLLLIHVGAASGQAPLEDFAGGTTVILQGGGAFGINSADKSLQLNYSGVATTRPFLWGVKAKVKSTDGAGVLFSSGGLGSGSELGATIATNLTECDAEAKVAGTCPADVLLGLVVSNHRQSASFYDSSQPVDSAVSTDTYDNGRALLVVNVTSTNMLVALGFGAERFNNLHELKKVTVVQDRSQRVEEGVLERTVVETEAMAGALVEETAAVVSVDVVRQLGSSDFSVRWYLRQPFFGEKGLGRGRLGFDLAFFEGDDMTWGRKVALMAERLSTASGGKWSVGLSVNLQLGS